jgi:hypothetical protein
MSAGTSSATVTKTPVSVIVVLFMVCSFIDVNGRNRRSIESSGMRR